MDKKHKALRCFKLQSCYTYRMHMPCERAALYLRPDGQALL
jgi:hypothetical protein